jgi:hypothetical protein
MHLQFVFLFQIIVIFSGGRGLHANLVFLAADLVFEPFFESVEKNRGGDLAVRFDEFVQMKPRLFGKHTE